MSFISGEPFQRTLVGLARLLVTVAGRGARAQRLNQPPRRLRHLVHGTVECQLVHPRRTVGTAQLADELQRGCANLLLCRWWLEIRQGLDVSAHVPIVRRSVRAS